MSAKLTELSRISSVDTGDLIYIARTVGDTGVSAAMSRADFEDNLHIKLSLAQDTGKYLADSGVFLGPLFKGDTGDVALWRTDGTVGEGPKLPQGTATGGTLADTGTAQTLSGKSLSGSSIVDTGVHLAAYFAGGVGADTGTFLRGDGNWRQIQLGRASDTGKYLADSGFALSDTIITTLGRSLIDDTGQTAMRSTLGLGTAAVKNTGTSGNAVPLLDGTNTWSGAQGIDNTLRVGSGSTVIGTFTARSAADSNFFVAANFNLSTGNAFGSVNDANNALRGMEFRASEILLSAASGVTASTFLKSSHATAGVGYATGAGGTVTQATSKSTGVTLNKATGQITMNGAALAANTTVSFTLTNSAIAAGDILVLNHISAGTAGAYALNAQSAAGSASINVRNITAGSLSEAIVISFGLIKAVTA